MSEPNAIPFVGGPVAGRSLAVAPSTRYVTVPVVSAGRVLTPEEFGDPANWELDLVTGLPRIKRPPIGEAVYELVGSELIFRPEGRAA